MTYDLYSEPGSVPATPPGWLRIIARGREWRQPEVVAIATTHEVGAACNELRGWYRQHRGYTPVLEVRDSSGQDVTHLFSREAR